MSIYYFKKIIILTNLTNECQQVICNFYLFEEDGTYIDLIDNFIYKGDNNVNLVMVKYDMLEENCLHLLKLEGDRPCIYIHLNI